METALPAITSPADLKALPLERLPELAEKIRQTLIETLS
ncbi:1-deoxy-D-xylulose-5-phosphate synthase N-terminal domain-containing protein, partial [Prosthecobacter sp.]